MIKEMRPIDFPEANGKLLGKGETIDLPVCFTADGNVCSCWHIPFIKRLKLIFSGRVYLVVKGKTHPPLWIDTSVFKKG